MAKAEQSTPTTVTAAKKKLKVLVPSYQENKTNEKIYKDAVSKEGAEIKDIMKAYNLAEFEEGGVIAKYNVSERTSFNNQALLEKLKALKDSKKLTPAIFRKIVKKVEIVDMDALEEALYKDQVEAAELSSCQESKVVATLTLGKVKNAPK